LNPPTTLYFLAGELSGDTHGAALLHALRESAPEKLVFAGRGGAQMRAIAGDLLENWTDQAAVVGLWEVLKNYGWFRAQFRRVLDEIFSQKPAAVVLIDYPGFNLRLAKALRRAGYRGKLIYYISPQVWAWHRGRIPLMARLLDLMICIFPFEKTLYEKSGLRTIFAGHPLLEQLEAERLPAGSVREADLIGLFPGSRGREVRKIFPVLLETARVLRRERPHLRFATPAATPERVEELRAIRASLAPAWTDAECAILPPGASRRLMQTAAVGLVASGTATVEAAFFGLPLAIVYRVASLTWWVGRAVVRVPFLGMINLLAGKEIAREFLQANAQPVALAAEVKRLLDDTDNARTKQAAELRAVVQILSGDDLPRTSTAAANAADVILAALRV